MEETKDNQHLQSPEKNASLSTHQTVDLKFSVPWGHIAAKVWGDPGGEPILAVHGVEDNAATFDTLIPLLLQLVGRPLYVVCVDLPGHGHSSPLAPGILYRFTDMLGCLHRVISQLGWYRFHYLGHSLGGLLGLHFVASYPNLVEKLILIDVITFVLYPRHYHSNLLRAYIEKLLELEKKCGAGTIQPSYTLDQALHKLAHNRGTKMTEAGIKALASRSLRQVEGHDNLYQFSRDSRLKFFVFPVIGNEEAVQIMSEVKCQLLIVTGKESLRAENGSPNEAVLNAVAKHCSYLKHHVVDGDHDVHLNFPERLAPLVARFLWKAWGDPCGQPVLCVHGILDNAGSFDGLIPLLPSVFYYVCVDLPGHGYSSHFPQGLPLDFMDYVLALVCVLNQLQWESCCYIGHSLGGHLGLYLCSLWPQKVRKLVLLDTIGPMYVTTDTYLAHNKMILEQVLTIEKKLSNKKSPSYSYKEALDRVMTNRYSKITGEAAKILLRRSLMKNDDGAFSFVTDQRLKSGLRPLLNERQQLLILNDAKCPILAVLSSLPRMTRTTDDVMINFELFINKQNFQYIDVKGGHDLYMNNPERVAPYIGKFLINKRCAL